MSDGSVIRAVTEVLVADFPMMSAGAAQIQAAAIPASQSPARAGYAMAALLVGHERHGRGDDHGHAGLVHGGQARPGRRTGLPRRAVRARHRRSTSASTPTRCRPASTSSSTRSSCGRKYLDPDHRRRVPAADRRRGPGRHPGAGRSRCGRARPGFGGPAQTGAGAHGGAAATGIGAGRGCARPEAVSGAGRQGGDAGLGGGAPFGAAGGIIGVASKSTEKSLRLYNGRGVYNEWTFVAVQRTQQAGAGAAGSATPGGGAGRGGRAGERGAGTGSGPNAAGRRTRLVPATHGRRPRLQARRRAASPLSRSAQALLSASITASWNAGRTCVMPSPARDGCTRLRQQHDVAGGLRIEPQARAGEAGVADRRVPTCACRTTRWAASCPTRARASCRARRHGGRRTRRIDACENAPARPSSTCSTCRAKAPTAGAVPNSPACPATPPSAKQFSSCTSPTSSRPPPRVELGRRDARAPRGRAAGTAAPRRRRRAAQNARRSDPRARRRGRGSRPAG